MLAFADKLPNGASKDCAPIPLQKRGDLRRGRILVDRALLRGFLLCHLHLNFLHDIWLKDYLRIVYYGIQDMLLEKSKRIQICKIPTLKSLQKLIYFNENKSGKLNFLELLEIN